MSCSSQRCWALPPHLSHFRIYLLHCFKVYPHKGKSSKNNGLGLTQNSENTNSNFVLRSGNISPPDAMLEKQLDPVVPVT